MLDKKWLLPTLVFGGFFSFYAYFVPDQPTGLHLSDIFISQSYFLGLLNSPGYPILTLIIFLSTRLLGSSMEVAVAAHLTSALLSALSLAGVFLITQLLYQYYHLKQRFVIYNHQITAALMGLVLVALLGFSNYFWRYSLFAHQFMLSQFLVVVVLFSSMNILTRPKTAGKFWISLVIGLGIGISHQWIFVPLALATTYLLRKPLLQLQPVRQGTLLILLAAFAFLPFLLLLQFQANEVEFSYTFEPTVAGLREYVTEAYLGDSTAISNDLNQIVQLTNLEFTLNNIWQIITLLIQSIGILGLGLVFAAVLFTNPPKKSNLLWQLGFTSLVVLFALGLVFSWEENLADYPEIIPQLIILHPLIVLLMWFGLYELITRFGAAISTLSKTTYVQAGITVIATVVIVSPAVIRAEQVSLQNKLATADVSQTILEEVESDAIIACFSYSSCYGLIYQQRINQLNSEAVILPFYYLPDRMVFSHSYLQGFDYGSYPMVMYDIITWNRQDRPIYSIDMFDDYFSLFGIDFGFLFYVPKGYYNQLTNQIPEELPETNLEISHQLLGYQIPRWDRALEKAKFDLIKRHMFNTSIYLKTGLRQRGVGEVNIATSLGYDLDPEIAREIATLRGSVESIQPNEFFDLGLEAETVSFILEQVDELEENRRYNRALMVARGAMTLDPSSVEARLRYASLLEINLASESAVVEYNNVLQLDPENELAQERLEYQRELGN